MDKLDDLISAVVGTYLLILRDLFRDNPTLLPILLFVAGIIGFKALVAKAKDGIARAEQDAKKREDENKALLAESHSEGEIGVCPSCGVALPLSALKCPKCKALFGAGSAWQVQPTDRKSGAP